MTCLQTGVSTLLGDLMFGSPESQTQEPLNYSSKLGNQTQKRNWLIRVRLKIASDRMKTWYDVWNNSMFWRGQGMVVNPKMMTGLLPKASNKLGRSISCKEENDERANTN